MPGSFRVLGHSSRDRAGELLGSNTASWHRAVHLPELCHDWKGLGLSCWVTSSCLLHNKVSDDQK